MKSSSSAPWESFRQLFDLDRGRIEEGVADLPGHYKDLDPRALYTSHEDLYRIMHDPKISGRWVDLGAGIGESALMYGLMFPERSAVAVECSAARVEAGKELRARLGVGNVEIMQGDLLHCPIPEGETYFLYFPTGPVLDRILDKLRRIDGLRRLVAIESHGDLFPRLAKENWLVPRDKIALTSPRHDPYALVFEKGEAPLTLGPHQLSYREKFLLVEGTWIGETQGLEWLRGDEYQLLTPPRTIEWNDTIEVLDLGDFPQAIQDLILWRRLPGVRITTRNSLHEGPIRKIITSPVLQVEMPSGERIDWDDVTSIVPLAISLVSG